MENISKERAKEILNKYYNDTYKKEGVRGGKYLFNWCEEYKKFIDDGVCCCVTSEIDYILKKSYEDNETPLTYEDLDLFDKDKAIEHLIYKKDNEEIILTQTKEELEEMSKEEVKDLFNELDLDTCEAEAEIYEWWVIQNTLKYRLEQEGEIFLENYWGRQTTGQGISCDNCCINAFISMIKDMFNLSEEDFKQKKKK